MAARYRRYHTAGSSGCDLLSRVRCRVFFITYTKPFVTLAFFGNCRRAQKKVSPGRRRPAASSRRTALSSASPCRTAPAPPLPRRPAASASSRRSRGRLAARHELLPPRPHCPPPQVRRSSSTCSTTRMPVQPRGAPYRLSPQPFAARRS